MKHNRPSVDNVTDLLNLIIQFTHTRRSVLAQNIQQSQTKSFVPMDLPADDFSHIINEALTEHLQSGRLLWRDTSAIHFGRSGAATFTPLPDAKAVHLHKTDMEAYLDHESRLLLENEINQKVAKGLLSRCWENAASSLPQS